MKAILKFFSVIVCVFIIGNAKAQSVYVSEWKKEAGKIIYVTDNPAEADLIVYKSEWKSDAKKESGIWYFTEWKNDADMIIYFTQYRSEADMVIYYTKDKNEAGRRK